MLLNHTNILMMMISHMKSQKEENEEAEQGPFSVPCNQYFEAISDIIHGLHNTLCEEMKL